MRLKKYWPALLGIGLQAENLWKFLKWALDWRGRYDALAATYHEVGGGGVVVGYVLDPPPWIYPVSFIAGFVLIWWNFHRNREQANVTNAPPLATVAANDATPQGNRLITPGQDAAVETIAPSKPTVEVPSSPSPPASSPPEAPSPPPAPEKPAKQFVDAGVTPEFLVGLYEGQTALGAEWRASKYIGKWIQVSGPLFDTVGGYPFMQGRTPVVASLSRELPPSILMVFHDEWLDRLATFAKNQNISVSGQIREIERAKIVLDPCELMDSDPATNAPAQSANAKTRPRRRRSSKGQTRMSLLGVIRKRFKSPPALPLPIPSPQYPLDTHLVGSNNRQTSS